MCAHPSPLSQVLERAISMAMPAPKDQGHHTISVSVPVYLLLSQFSEFLSVFSPKEEKKYLLSLFSCQVTSHSLQLHGLQPARFPCPSLSPRVYSNPCPLSRWCHPTISFSVTPFSSCLQPFPASGYFPMSQLFPSGGQSIAASASASVLLMSIQGWFPLGLTGLISLLSKNIFYLMPSMCQDHASAFMYYYLT